jgi:hypothetical protein
MIKMNKIGDEKILSIWWFVCLILIGSAILIVLMNHFGTTVDTRSKDVMMLQEKIMDCIVENGYFKQNIPSKDYFEFLNFCNLNENQFKDDGVFLFNLTIYNSSKKVNSTHVGGHIAYQQDCKVIAGKKAANYPYCIESMEQVIYFNKEQGIKETWEIYLLVASNNKGSKISTLKTPGGIN